VCHMLCFFILFDLIIQIIFDEEYKPWIPHYTGFAIILSACCFELLIVIIYVVSLNSFPHNFLFILTGCS
jgi:hypothetical protein